MRNYRTTPHATTEVAPAVLLLNRPVRNKLLQANHVDPVSEPIRKQDFSQKANIKANADNKTYVKPDEAVLVERPFTVSKGETACDPNPMVVVGKKGSMKCISVGNGNSTVTRNSSFFKSLDQSANNPENDESLDSSFDSQRQTDKECIRETPAVTPTPLEDTTKLISRFPTTLF